MSMTRAAAEKVARTLRHAVDAGRWSPPRYVEDLLLDLERFLHIRIQVGQPELEAMNWRLIERPASVLLGIGMRAMSDGAFGVATPSEIALFGRPPAPRIVAAPGLPLLDALSLAA